MGNQGKSETSGSVASAALEQVEREVADFFGALSPEELVLRVASAWTPAEHLAHLNTAASAVARGLSISRWLLRLRFGRARRPSRSYEQLVADYRGRLAAGGKASAAFIPPIEELTGEQREVRRRELLARWHRVNARLRAALAQWSEADLDRIQLPHPLLVKITTREMVYFVIYHGHHHIDRAQSRLPRYQTPPEAASRAE